MNAVKKALTYREEMFPGFGNVPLFACSAARRPIGGVVVIVHGFMAHSGMYRWTAERLVALGLAVYAFDLRGMWSNGGRNASGSTDFSDYVGDLERFVGLVRAREPGAPTYLLGHSAGGIVASLYAVDHQAELAG